MKAISRHCYHALALFAFACFALSLQARADCREGCDGGNTFLGDSALSNSTVGGNTAVGDQALSHSTTAYENTAVGTQALVNNTTGINNTAVGWMAGAENNGNNNTAIGLGALEHDLSGDDNTAIGHDVLAINNFGSFDTAVGSNALSHNTTGSDNTAVGEDALLNNTIGFDNVAIGYQAGLNLDAGNNNIYVGNGGAAQESGIIRIGTEGTQTTTFIAGIVHSTLAVGVPVIINPGGRLGISTSSERFKEAIKPMDNASEAILALKPVSFHYKKDLDPDAIPQFGLVAEDVQKVNPDLVVRDEQGKPYTVRYHAVNAMLLNEFLKEHRRVEKLEASMAELQSIVKEQTSELRAVRKEIKTFRSAIPVVNSD